MRVGHRGLSWQACAECHAVLNVPERLWTKDDRGNARTLAHARAPSHARARVHAHARSAGQAQQRAKPGQAQQRAKPDRGGTRICWTSACVYALIHICTHA